MGPNLGGNIRPNLHNVVMIVGIAVLGIIALKMLANTRVASVPVLGDAIRFAQAA